MYFDVIDSEFDAFFIQKKCSDNRTNIFYMHFNIGCESYEHVILLKIARMNSRIALN